MTRHPTALFVIALFLPVAMAEASDRAQVTIQIRWADPIDEVTLADTVDRLRITSETNVVLRVTHFNFLHYSLQYTVEVKEVESYQLLNTLWSQLLGLFPVAETATVSVSDFEKALLAWRKKLAEVDETLTTTLNAYAGKRALTEHEVSAIAAAIATVGTVPLEDIERLRRQTLALAEFSAELDLYDRIAAQHRLITQRLLSFITSAELVKTGQTHVIGRRKAGTRVTLTVRPIDIHEATAGSPLNVSYFVRSVYPLAFHVGYAAAKLTDVEFDKVRSLSGADLFVATKENDTTQSLVAFMSYELWNWGSGADIGVQTTLGTSFEKPGTTFYAGGGIRVLRFVFSIGRASQEVAEGRRPIVETLGAALGTRELFATIARRRAWGQFFSASVRVF